MSKADRKRGMKAGASNPRALLADIGGTNCRLRLEGGDEAARQKTYSTADFASAVDAVMAFLAEGGGARPTLAAMAVAGPVVRGPVALTNTSWVIDRDALVTALGLDRLIVVNDMAAQARAVLDLGPEALAALGGPAEPSRAGAVSVVGPGTGLGVARAVRGAPPQVAATEGGHVGFAPEDDVELALLAVWRKTLGRVTNEHLASGPGLVRIHSGLGALEGVEVEPLEGPEITTRALAGADALCLEAVRRFAKILGGACGDTVLAQGAGGLVLVGGVANALAPILREGGFRARFAQRGPGGNFLAATPSHLAAAPDLGLAGARAFLTDVLETEM
jgi:glucokinase